MTDLNTQDNTGTQLDAAAPSTSIAIPLPPDIPQPADNTAAVLSLLLESGHVPALLRWFEPAAFDRALDVLNTSGFPLELRNDGRYYLATADDQPGSLSYLRGIIDSHPSGFWYRDRCSRELAALLDRVEHYTLRLILDRGMLAAQCATKAADEPATTTGDQ